MPIIGAIIGDLDFSNSFAPLSSNVTATALADAKKQSAVLAWGNFLTIAPEFLDHRLCVVSRHQGNKSAEDGRTGASASGVVQGSAVTDRHPGRTEEPVLYRAGRSRWRKRPGTSTVAVSMPTEYFSPHSPDQFIKLRLDGRPIPALRVLNDEDHQKRNDGCARIDNELPRI